MLLTVQGVRPTVTGPTHYVTTAPVAVRLRGFATVAPPKDDVMKPAHSHAEARSFRMSIAAITAVIAAFSIGLVLVLTSAAQAAATVVNLGTAGQFAVLAATGITNTGATTISGNIGSYPDGSVTHLSDITFIPPSKNHGNDDVTKGAKADLVTAYNQAAGEKPAQVVVGGLLGGKTLTAGVYSASPRSTSPARWFSTARTTPTRCSSSRPGRQSPRRPTASCGSSTAPRRATCSGRSVLRRHSRPARFSSGASWH